MATNPTPFSLKLKTFNMHSHLNKNTNIQTFKTNLKKSVHSKLNLSEQKQRKIIISETYKQQLATGKENLLNEHYVQLFLLS